MDLFTLEALIALLDPLVPDPSMANDDPPLPTRLGVSAARWETLVCTNSRRCTRELDIMAMMFAEAQRRS